MSDNWQPEPDRLLNPTVTPGPSGVLKPDENYSFMISDREVDRRAREGHGWVRPRADSLQAKCAPWSCGICRREQEILDAGGFDD